MKKNDFIIQSFKSVTIIFLLAAVCCTSAVVAVEPNQVNVATLGIQARWPVAIKTMGEKARVYINHKDNFTQIPEFLQGLQYTLHHRKRIINISCRVKASGRIYLCLFGDKTPESIGQHRDWKKCGTMPGPSFQGKKWWTIYHADVKVGQILTFSRDDKMGLTIAAKKITKDKTRPLAVHRAALRTAPAVEGVQPRRPCVQPVQLRSRRLLPPRCRRGRMGQPWRR